MRCTKCGTENPDGKRFCGDCGSVLPHRCPKCGAENPTDKRFCGDCGTALAHDATSPAATTHKPPASAAAIRIAPERPDASTTIEGERKTVTALFADIKDSTELMRDLDPEEARAIVDPALKLMIDAAHRYDGYVVQSTGDGIFALFGAPIAHEDHPQRALHAALAIQEELRLYADRLRGEGRIPVEARVGANTGEVVVRTIATGAGHTEYTPIGHTTNLASRMQTLANPGSTVIAEITRKLVEGYFQLKALGPSRVKGISEPVAVYEVVRVGPLRTHFQLSARRGLTKFVGRAREMEALRHATEQAKDGHGQVVAAMAEPGVGKSRLMYEFKATIPDGCKVLEAYPVSNSKTSAWLPVIELLKSYFEIADEDGDGRRSAKIEAKMRALDPALADTLPYILTLLGIAGAGPSLAMMDAQVKRRHTLEAIKRIIIAESLKQPLVVIFEDLHWIDAETQELLDLLVDSIASARILMLVNYRPEYHHQWGNRTCYTQLRLDPLGRENAGEMLTALLGDGADLLPLKRLIIERTEGNPFFMEEIVQTLFEQGVLERDGAVKLVKRLAQVRIPPTVQGMLAARIDALAAVHKDLLQTLAVIGKEFALGLVREVTGLPDEELAGMLRSLQGGEFIYEKPAAGAPEYSFKHALTQEVTYNSVLIERRKRLHAKVAEALEAFHSERLNDHYNELIHHNSRAGDVGKALRYLRLATERGYALGAYEQVLGYEESALGLLETLKEGAERTEQEIFWLHLLGWTLAPIRGWQNEEAAGAFRRLGELSRQTGNSRELMRALSALKLYHLNRYELHKARAVAEEHLAIASRARDPVQQASAHAGLGDVLIDLGEFTEARKNIEKASSFLAALAATKDCGGYTQLQLRGLRGYSAQRAPEALWFLGFPDRARRRSEEALIVAREAEPLILAHALTFTAHMHADCREPQAVRHRIGQLLAIVNRYGLHSHFFEYANELQGRVLLLEGRFEGAVEALRNAPRANLFLALAYPAAGQAKKALETADRALAELYRSDYRAYESAAHHIRGEVLLFQEEPLTEEAERCFRTAVEIAQRQSARSLELRATTSLARLLDKQGRRDEARAMLAEIYGWFTEGLDTADLKDAKALLDELNA